MAQVDASIDVWGAVRDERGALLGDLERLTTEQWEAQSLCTGWKVRDVVAHLIVAVDAGVAVLLTGLLRHRFDVDRMLGEQARRRARDETPITLLSAYRGTVASQRKPPGIRPVNMLADTLIHGQDIRRPLGLRRDFPRDRVCAALDALLPSNAAVRARTRSTGLRLRATDVEWMRGDGPEVAGPAEALLLAVAGRPVALDDLGGDGIAILRERMASSG